MRTKKHQKIADAFAELNSALDEKKDKYLEKISKVINKAVKKHEDKDLWEESYNKIVDLIYAGLTDVYLKTTLTLKDAYTEVADEVLDLEDFLYKDDGMTLPERVKKYWDEAETLLENPETDTQEISLYLLSMYDRILTTEMENVKTGVKKTKEAKNTSDLIPVIEVVHNDGCGCGMCDVMEGFYLEEDEPETPPYHPGCRCDWWLDFYDPTDEKDLEVLQEAGWEPDDE